MLAAVTRRSMALALRCAGPSPSSSSARRLALAATTTNTTAPKRRRRAATATALAAAAASAATGAEGEKPVRLDKLLSNLGYGSRREVAALIRGGRVEEQGGPGAPPSPKSSSGGGKKQKAGLRLSADSRALPSRVLLDGAPLDPRAPLTLLLNKPEGYVVTSPDDPKAAGAPTVYDLLPERYGARKPALGPAGRLDKATSGLLILTDDGQLAHRVMSPKKKDARRLWKEYEATLDAAMSRGELASAARLFASGEMVLAGDDGSPSAGRPLLPARISPAPAPASAAPAAFAAASADGDGDGGASTSVVRVRVCEGRYHQVRRMMAAVGREVVALTRLSVGGLALALAIDEEEEGAAGAAAGGNAAGGGAAAAAVRLAPGEWRAATAADLAALFSGGGRAEEEEEEEEEEGGGGGGAGEEEEGGDEDDARAAAAAPALRGEDLDSAEMHRRARIDARRREKRQSAKNDVLAR